MRTDTQDNYSVDLVLKFGMISKFINLYWLSVYLLWGLTSADENSAMINNTTHNELRELGKAKGEVDVALLDGDMKALESLLYSNETQV